MMVKKDVLIIGGSASGIVTAVAGKSKYPDNSNKRYYFVNLHSIWYHNTIEIRLHSGTTNFNKIKNWILINRKFIDWLMKTETTIGDVKKLNEVKFSKIMGKGLTNYMNKRIELFKNGIEEKR